MKWVAGIIITLLLVGGGAFWWIRKQNGTVFKDIGIDVRIDNRKKGEHSIVASADPWRVWHVTNIRRKRNYVEAKTGPYIDEYYFWGIVESYNENKLNMRMQDGDTVQADISLADFTKYEVETKKRTVVPRLEWKLKPQDIVYVEWYGEVQTDPLVDELLDANGKLTEFAKNIKPRHVIFVEGKK